MRIRYRSGRGIERRRRATLMKGVMLVLSRLAGSVLLVSCLLGITGWQAQAQASDWQLIKSNVGTKRFNVNLTLRAVTTNTFPVSWTDDQGVEHTTYFPPGITVGTASVELPGASWVRMNARADWTWDPQTLTDQWGPVFRVIDFWVEDYDTGGTARRCQLVSQTKDVQFSVSVSGQADRYGRLVQTPGDGWWMGIGRRNGAADIMPETRVEYKDVVDHPTVTITLGDDHFTYTSTQTDITDNKIGILACGQKSDKNAPTEKDADGYWIIPPDPVSEYDGAYDSANTIWVEGTYSRSTGVAEETRAFSYSRDIPEDEWGTTLLHPMYHGIHGETLTLRRNATVGGGHISCGGGYENGSGDGWNDTNGGSGTSTYAEVDFYDYCGPYDVNYARDIRNMGGSPRTDVLVRGYEQHPTEEVTPVAGLQQDPPYNETVGHSSHTYSWVNNYIDLSSGPVIRYGGLWHVDTHMPGGSQDYIDLPYNVQSGPVNHGLLTADNIKDTWNQETSSYIDNSPGEPSHPGWLPWPDQDYDDVTGEPGFAPNGEPIWAYNDSDNGWPWYDNQVLVKGGWTAPDALQITLAAPGDVPNPPLSFFNLDGWAVTGGTWSKSAPYLIVNTLTSGTAIAEISDLLPENIRLTGTRFAKVKWSASRAGAQATLSLGGHSWNLKADTAGAQTALIDLCSPDESVVPGLIRTTSQQSTGTVDQVIESSHPTVGPADDWYTITAPEGTTSMSLCFSQVEGENGYIEIYDKDSNYLDVVYNWSGGQWCFVPDRIVKIRVTASQGASIYGFRVTRYRYTKAATVDASIMQSIIPYEQPEDVSLYDVQLERYKRQPDSAYNWEFPAGWGVGRVVSVKLECKTQDTQYGFDCIQLYRKTPQEGGFAKLYVLPHQPSWNDSRQPGDWSWFDSGGMVFSDPGNYRYVIRKAHLVVDGAVVLEIPAGFCEQKTGGGGDSTYGYALKKLLSDEGSGMHVLAYPVDDYANPSRYATNGVATLDVDLTQASDFVKANCYVTYLVGGTYAEDAENKIKVPLDITPDGISPYMGSLGTVARGMTKRLRGGAQGLAFDEDKKPAANRQVRVVTPNAPSGQKTDTAVTTNLLGWFESPAVNTKGDAELETSVGETYITTRNRFLSRIAIAPLGLGSSTFEITDVDPFVVEPVYADTVQIKWRRTDGLSNAQSILILRRNDSGTVTGSDGLKYDQVAAIALGQSGQESENPAWDPATNPYRWLGAATWQPPADQAVGRYDIGVQYADHVQTKWSNGSNGQSFWPHLYVALSVYDVYSDNSAPFYVDDDATNQGQTTIHYTLSSQTTNGAVIVAGKQLPSWSGDKGENHVYWDGKMSEDEGTYCDTGVYAIEILPTAPSHDILIGPHLSVWQPTAWKVSGSSSTQTNSFDPEAGDSVEVRYRILEPVRREQATMAYMTAICYDAETGEPVRILADGAQNDLDNDGKSSTETGHNTLVWDGKDFAGDSVGPGDYTITLFAEDNAGVVRCQSGLVSVAIEVLPHEDTSPFVEINDDVLDSPPGTIYGSTNGAASVEWTDSAGGQGSVMPDADGNVEFAVDPSPGEHIVTAVIRESGTIVAQEQLNLFFGQLSLSSPSGFDLSEGQSLSAVINSQAADTVDVEITDPFQSDSCIDPSSPIAGADLLNGALSEPKAIRHFSNLALIPGANTLTWDGRDDSGAIVPVGVYQLEVTSQHEYDGGQAGTWITVDSPTSGLTITGVQVQAQGAGLAVTWSTNAPTHGCVDYRQGDSAIACVRASDDLATAHIVWLPDVVPGTTYQYYVKVWDDVGHANVTRVQEATAGTGPSIFDVAASADSSTQATITWLTDVASISKVSYITVWPVGNSSWTVVEDDVPVQNHRIVLTGLQASAEYAVRVSSSTNTQWTDQASYKFVTLTTEDTPPSVKIVSPGNMAVVSGLVDITVEASDDHPRFTAKGIMYLEVSVDGNPAELVSHETDSATWTFRWDATSSGPGIHRVVASAMDDFWNPADYAIDVLTDATQSRTPASAPGAPSESSKIKGAVEAVTPEVPQPLWVPFYPQGGWKDKFNGAKGYHHNMGCGRASKQMLIWYYYRINDLDDVYRQAHNQIQDEPPFPQAHKDNINSDLNKLREKLTPEQAAKVPTYAHYTPADLKKNKNSLQPIVRSILAGRPALVYTNLYGGPHIFILTGYDKKNNVFYANDTFCYPWEARKDKNGKRVVEEDEVKRKEHRDPAVAQSVTSLRRWGPLTPKYILNHLRPQGNKCFIYSPVK